MQNFLHFSIALAPLHQESLVCCRIVSLLMQNFLHLFHIFALLHQTSLGFHRIFSSDATFPIFSTCLACLALLQDSHMRIQTYHHSASRICKFTDVLTKTILSAKLFFTYSKRSPPELILERFFNIRKLQPKTKIYVCNHFGRNGNKRISKFSRALENGRILLTFPMIGACCWSLSRISRHGPF